MCVVKGSSKKCALKYNKTLYCFGRYIVIVFVRNESILVGITIRAGKTSRLKIEEVINEALSGDTQKNALKFIFHVPGLNPPSLDGHL